MTRYGYFLSSEEYDPASLIEQARMAERAGFDALWISDHFHPWLDEQGQSSFVWSVIGAISQVSSLPITTAVTCPTTRIHPAVIAQAAATAGLLTGGRFNLGVGTGEALNEHVTGAKWPAAEERQEMLEEAVTIIAELFTGEQLTYHGPHYQVETARLYSVPRVPPPIYVSGFGEKSARLIQLAIFAVFALPGYFLAIALLDKTGRRPIQLLGFGLMGAMFLLIGLVPGVTQNAAPFLALYGISFFFTGFGPNTTTFVYPAELFPVQVRTTGHGISAALGKMGAFAGAFLFPVMLASSLGIRGTEVVAALVLLAGLALTAFLLPEPRGKSLEELSAQAYNLPGLALAPTWARAGTPGGARQRGASRTALKADERGGRWP